MNFRDGYLKLGSSHRIRVRSQNSLGWKGCGKSLVQTPAQSRVSLGVRPGAQGFVQIELETLQAQRWHKTFWATCQTTRLTSYRKGGPWSPA